MGPEESLRKSIRRRRKAVGGRVGAHPEVSRGRLTQGAQTQRERYARPKNEPPGESPPRQLWRQSIQTSRIQGKWAHFFVTTVSGFFWTLRKKLKYKKLKQIIQKLNISRLLNVVLLIVSASITATFPLKISGQRRSVRLRAKTKVVGNRRKGRP